MPRTSNGSYVQPGGTTAVTGTTISSTAFNTLESDIGQEITNSMDRLGRGAAEANINLGGYLINDLAAPIAGTDAVNLTTSLANATAAAAALNLGQGGVGLLTTLPSNATADLGTITTHNIQITGTTTITSFGSSGSTSFPLYLVEFAGALTLTYNATSLILPGAANITTAAGDSLIALYLGSGNWQVYTYTPASGLPVVAPAVSPGGRLTLTTSVPVLPSAVTAASSIIYTPYIGAPMPQWNGSAWVPTTFAEISQALSDTTRSPAAAVANSLYDLFVWFNAGVATLSRGPVWTNSTTRSLALSRVSGFLVNSLAITNGPAGGYGLYVGTIATDVSAAAVTFNPIPTAASGGPTGGAWVGLWNEYNRVPLGALVQDSKASWTYGTGVWRSVDGSNNNRVTYVVGQPEDGLSASTNGYLSAGGPGSFNALGIGLDSTTTAVVAAVAQSDNGNAASPGLAVTYSGPTLLGQHFIQAVENNVSGTTPTFYGLYVAGVQTQQLSAQLRY